MTDRASQLVEDIESQRTAILSFTSDLIATPSPTPPGDESVIAEFVTSHMAGLGLEGAQIFEAAPRRANVLWRSGNGIPGPRIALNGHIDTISLTVKDSGAGSHPHEAMRGPGLGLTSMKERLKVIGGQLSIHSQQGLGTTIYAVAPLRLPTKSAETHSS